jgi:glutamate dehydrogenase (NADP+)
MLETKGSSFAGKTVVSGSGNVAQYSTEKTQLGGKVVTMSDSAGYIYDAEGIDAEKAFVMELKNELRGRISSMLRNIKR